MLKLNQIPQLPARTTVSPLTNLSPTAQCQTCQTSASGKQGSWYSLGGQAYCQDCAPTAARQAEVDLVRPTTAKQEKIIDLTPSNQTRP